MRVFLSWSGNTSHKLGLALRDWLPLVLPFVKPYISSEDIDKGAKWLPDIVKELEASHYGVILLTKDNVNAPWMVFEAGVLMKAVQESRVSPLLFDLAPTDFSGPLTQFQCTRIEKEDFKKLVRGINMAASDKERIGEGNLDRIFDKWWGELDQDFQRIRTETEQEQSSGKPAPPPSREQEMLAELLSLTRNLQMLLHSPETILPEYYLDSLLRGNVYSSVMDTAKILNAVSQLVKGYGRIEQKIVDYKGRMKDDSFAKELAAQIISLKKPIELLANLEMRG